jgi:spectinomycin phosphotransferase
VRARPEGFDEGDLVDGLRDGWGLSVVATTYAPVGGGSYHWRVEDEVGARHWVTVDDLDHNGFLGGTRAEVLDGLRRAFDTTCALRAAGLDFVVAPVPTLGGASLRPVGGRYALSVFPFLTARAGRYGEPRSAAERSEVIDILVQLHRTNAAGGVARLALPRVPHRTELERALAEAGRRWSGGPYAERAGALFAQRAAEVRRAVATFDQLARVVHVAGVPTVLTHGEPHPGNIMVADGRVLLVDWDTVALARPERDLWMLDRVDELAQYTQASGRPVDDRAIRLYQLRWELDDIASAVHRLGSRHDDNADSARLFRGFAGSLELTGVWPYGRSG